MQAFLEFVVGSLVDEPLEVSVKPIERRGVTVYEVRVSPEDAGKVIGTGPTESFLKGPVKAPAKTAVSKGAADANAA